MYIFYENFAFHLPFLLVDRLPKPDLKLPWPCLQGNKSRSDNFLPV